MNMKININNVNNTTFSSRNLEIRKADDIMRNMLNKYPSQSTTKLCTYSVIKNPQLNLDSLFSAKTFSKMLQIRVMRSNVPESGLLNRVIEDVKKYKIANCGELALLAKGAFLANGYKDLQLVNLGVKSNSFYDGTFEERYETLDHSLLLVNAGDSDIRTPKNMNKQAIIVDPWSGMVDYVHSGLKEYERILGNCIRGKGKKHFIFSKSEIDTSTDTCQKLKKEHPEFIV